MQYDKKLIEVACPMRRSTPHPSGEMSVQHGHPQSRICNCRASRASILANYKSFCTQ